MTKSFKIESLDANQAYLLSDDNQRLLVPRNFVSEKALAGDQVLLSVQETKNLSTDNKELAQEILNEILHIQ
ncbi:MAG TPA: hypothetical protein PKI61_00655 [bacterium]|nr:hypothetical protein [bacterium]HPT29398.1 hypothetical protein [bacterium]